MVKEMKKFRKLLKDAGIEYEDWSDGDIDRTHFNFRGFEWSAVNGYGTYGGYIGSSSKNEGLLELNSSDEDEDYPIGYLTAEEAMKYVKGEEDAT